MKTKTLLIILLVLATAYAGITFFGGNSNKSDGLRNKLVEIDTAKVSKFVLTRGGEVAEMQQEGGIWKGKTKTGQWVPLEGGQVEAALAQLLEIVPSRLVSRDESKWNEYQVDTSGVQVQVFEGEAKTLDLMIGKLVPKNTGGGQMGQMSFSTYVRLASDKETYSADNFFGMAFSADLSGFRNTKILSFEPDSVNSITFTYPSDSSFSLQKKDGIWALDGKAVAQDKVLAYLREIRYASSNTFHDAPLAGEASMKVAFGTEGGAVVDAKAYQYADGWVISGSVNPQSAFLDTAMWRRIFRGKGYFAEKKK